MAVFHIPNVSVKGISACVPPFIDRNIDSNLHPRKEMERLIESIGVEEKRIADESTTTSDLCFQAAERLIEDLGWVKKDIEALVFVTQTPDYILPATSCILQDRLGLSNECFTLDVSLGCSGWVYGINVVASLLASGAIKKALLLVGDTTSKTTGREDKASWPLFGDAGTATALEYTPGKGGFVFHCGTDGSGSDLIKIPHGGFREMFNSSSLEYYDIPDNGGRRNNMTGSIQGMDIFAFSIIRVPKSVRKVLSEIAAETKDIDYFLFHQANLFLNETLRKKLKLDETQVPYNLRKYGNTSGASIPLLMVTELSEQLSTRHLRLIASGFGVGLSWNTMYFETDNIVVPKLVEYSNL